MYHGVGFGSLVCHKDFHESMVLWLLLENFLEFNIKYSLFIRPNFKPCGLYYLCREFSFLPEGGVGYAM
jgi:hypothetical protein